MKKNIHFLLISVLTLVIACSEESPSTKANELQQSNDINSNELTEDDAKNAIISITTDVTDGFTGTGSQYFSIIGVSEWVTGLRVKSKTVRTIKANLTTHFHSSAINEDYIKEVSFTFVFIENKWYLQSGYISGNPGPHDGYLSRWLENNIYVEL